MSVRIPFTRPWLVREPRGRRWWVFLPGSAIALVLTHAVMAWPSGTNTLLLAIATTLDVGFTCFWWREDHRSEPAEGDRR